MSREVEWWSDLDEHVLGAVLLDTTDQDWAWVALGRDEKGLFRAIDLEVSIETQRKASPRLRVRLQNMRSLTKRSFRSTTRTRKRTSS
jgi:hypothetical protein